MTHAQTRPQAATSASSPTAPPVHPDVWEMSLEAAQALPGGDWFGPAVEIVVVGEWPADDGTGEERR